MTTEAASQPQLPSAVFESRHHGGSDKRRLHIKLTRSPQTGNILEALALDPGFRYSVGSPDDSEDDSWNLHHDAQENTRIKGKNGSLSSSSSTTTIGVPARWALRKWGFDLVAMGMGTARLSGLEEEHIPSLNHGQIHTLFQRRARAVDGLLNALDCARQWSTEQIIDLCSKVEGCPPDIVKKLGIIFGESLSADLVVNTFSPVGSTIAPIYDKEGSFNTSLHRSVIAAANAVLRLMEMVRDETEEGLSEGSSSVEDKDDDRMAAVAIVRAVQRYYTGPTLQFFDSGSGKMPKGLHPDVDASRLSQPDWILVSREESEYCRKADVMEVTTCVRMLTDLHIHSGGVTLHGVIEHKPYANDEFLREFCSPQLSPLKQLSSNTKMDQTSSQPAANSGSSTQPRRAAARKCLKESPPTPEAIHRKRSILDHLNRQPEYGYLDSSPLQKVALQLCSQLSLYNVRHGLLLADWGRALLPVQLVPESQVVSPALEIRSDSANPFALFCAPVARSDTSPLVEASNLLHDQTVMSQTLGSSNVPNVIMGLVKWALFAAADQRRRGGPIPPGKPTPLSVAISIETREGHSVPDGGSSHPGASGNAPDLGNRGLDGNDLSDGDHGHTHRAFSSRDNLHLTGSHTFQRQSGSIQASSPSSCGSMTTNDSDSAVSSESPPRSLAPGMHPGSDKQTPTTPTTHWSVKLVPFAWGRFADVHRGTIRRPGLPEQSCVYKLNCPPGWRLRRSGESSDDDGEEEQEDAAHDRFDKELDALKALEDLQGTVVPRLLGQSRLLSQDSTSPPSLVLEDVGKRVDEVDAWPSSMPDEQKRRLVVDAYSRLHEAGWVHGDVAPRNIMVSFSPDRGAEDAVRVCLVDFARAKRLDRFSLSRENSELKEVLDFLFGVDE